MMTPVKKIKFNHTGVRSTLFITLFITMIFIVTALFNLVLFDSPEYVDFLFLKYLFIWYPIIAINALIIFYKGVNISEAFLKKCKTKTVADPNGVFHITLTSSSGRMSDEEKAKYIKVKDPIHLFTFVGSLLCEIILFIMESSCSMRTLYTTALCALMSILIFNIVVYFKGQEVTIN